MAPLTWQNVAAPNFSGANQSMAQSAALLAGSMDGLGDALGRFEAKRRRATLDSTAANIAGYNSLAALDAARANGSIQLSDADAAKMFMDARTGLLNNENITARTAGVNLQNDATSYALNRSKVEAGREDDRFNAMRQASPLVTKAYLMATSGDLDGARKIIGDNAETFGQAGINTIDQLNQYGVGFDTNMSREEATARHAQTMAGLNAAKSAESMVDNLFQQRDIYNTPEKIKGAIYSSSQPRSVQLAALQILEQNGVPLDPNSVARAQQADQFDLGSNRGAPLQSLIDKTEGGGRYDTLFGNAQRNGGAFAGVDVSKMTLAELDRFQSGDGAYGNYVKGALARAGQDPRIATPIGRYQIVGTTLRNAAKEMGLSPDTVFDENTQDAVFNHLVEKRISGPRTMDGKISGLRAEWEGFKNVSNKDLAAAITAFEGGDASALKGFTTRPSNAGPVNPETIAQGGTLGSAAPIPAASSVARDLSTQVNSILGSSVGGIENDAAALTSAVNGSGRTALVAAPVGSSGSMTAPEAANLITQAAPSSTAAGADVSDTVDLPVADGLAAAGDTTGAANQVSGKVDFKKPNASNYSPIEVDPARSAFVQDVQSMARGQDIRGAVQAIAYEISNGNAPGSKGGNLGSFVGGSLYDYFAETPETAASNDAARARTSTALDWWMSSGARDYFEKNPDQIGAAASDPIQFYEEYTKQGFNKPSDAETLTRTAAPAQGGQGNKSATPAATPQAPSRQTTQQKLVDMAQNPKVSVEDMLSRASATTIMDGANDRFSPIRAALDPAQTATDALTVANGLKEAGLESLSESERLQQVNTVANRFGVPPSVAGALIRSALTQEGGWLYGFGDKTVVDMDQVEANWRAFQSENGTIGNGVSQLQIQEGRARNAKAIQDNQALLDRAKAIRDGRKASATTKAERKAADEEYKQAVEAIKMNIASSVQADLLETYSAGNTSR